MPRKDRVLNYTVGNNGERHCKAGYNKTKGGKCAPPTRAKRVKKAVVQQDTSTDLRHTDGSVVHKGSRGGHYIYKNSKKVYLSQSQIKNLQENVNILIGVGAKK